LVQVVKDIPDDRTQNEAEMAHAFALAEGFAVPHSMALRVELLFGANKEYCTWVWMLFLTIES
jgi:hypothetical protein